MGGALTVDSPPAGGARFSFQIPLRAEEDRPTTEASPLRRVRHLVAGSRVRALVVDDVPDNRDILVWHLHRIGVETRQASGGREAIEMVRAHPTDLVFMDIRMPDMDGVEAMEQIWQEHDRTSVRIVALSASVLDHQRREYLDAGFDDFIDKPFRTEAIFDCMARLLGVQYEYEEEEPDSHAEEDSLYRVTELRRCLEEVAQLGQEGQLLAASLSQLVKDYDMSGIVDLLDRGPLDTAESTEPTS